MHFDNLLGVIKLSDDGRTPAHDKSPIVQVLRATKFDHPEYGTVEITASHLKKFKENFDARVRRQDIPIDYFHENEGLAAGWIKELFFDDTGQELWAKVDWTKNALQKLNEKELRYFSPEFAFKWTDPETKVSYENVLFGGGLTNRPQVKDMAPIILKEQKGKQMEEKVKELETQVIKLGEDLKVAQGDAEKNAAAIGEKDKEMEMLKAQLAEAQKKLEEYAEKEKAMLAEKEKMCKEAEFNTMLSEGKVCEAQRGSFIAGDMKEFIKNAKAVNLSENGNGGGAKETSGTSDVAGEVMKLAEERAKKDKISLGNAVSLVLKENEELSKKYYA